jgi:hypothetical protein
LECFLVDLQGSGSRLFVRLRPYCSPGIFNVVSVRQRPTPVEEDAVDRIDLKNPDELTTDNVREFLRSGDDSTNTQIRVTNDGIAYLSKTVGGHDLEGVKFQMETFGAGNGYVGEGAANDDEWVREVHETLREGWYGDRRGLADD